MGFFSNLFRSLENNSSSHQADMKAWQEYQNKYLNVWNLIGEYTEKINYYYSNYINNNKQEDFNNLFLYCQKYIELLPQLEEAKKEDSRINNTVYTNNYCVAYHKLAMAYEKGCCYNSAINVCNDAIAKGYTDGTKGGFEARLARIMKKQAEINNKK